MTAMASSAPKPATPARSVEIARTMNDRGKQVVWEILRQRSARPNISAEEELPLLEKAHGFFRAAQQHHGGSTPDTLGDGLAAEVAAKLAALRQRANARPPAAELVKPKCARSLPSFAGPNEPTDPRLSIPPPR